jgi:hypothetical protein
MKKKAQLPQEEFQLGSTNPLVQNMVINFFRKEGIPVSVTTEYDPVFPILIWDGVTITQSKAERDKKYSVEEFIDQFFTSYKTIEIGSYSSVIDSGDVIKVGCQSISFETVEQVYMAMLQLRN